VEQLPPALAGLADHRQFMLWKKAWNADLKKFDKYPVDPASKRVVSAHDPAVWVSAEAAFSHAKGTDLGIAFVFTDADPFFFVDIDACYDGAWSATATELCTHFRGCAVEVSQSGKGLHIIGTAETLPHGCKSKTVAADLYTEGRFIALTGTGATGDVNTCPPGALVSAIAKYFPPDVAHDDADWSDAPVPEWAGLTDDDQLIEKMMTSTGGASVFSDRASVQDLWMADEDALGLNFPHDQGTHPFDHNRADMALCAHLAFWTGKDCERIDRLFRRSQLYRDKWENREPYRRQTILQVVGNCGAVYGGPRTPAITTAQPGPKAAPESVAPQATTNRGKPELRSGFQYLAVTQQIELFAGCVYVSSDHAVFIPSGYLLSPERFRVKFGGYVFALDATNDKTSKNAWEIFTESQAVHFPSADAPCFRPECAPGEIIEEEDQLLVNTYVPIKTKKTKGDPTPFLALLCKMLPIETDRDILLAYMSACVQHVGTKFQWTPLLQGVQGNGKTLFISCVSAAVGHRYTHLPNAKELGTGGTKFNSWLAGKLFIGVEEIYVSDRREVSDALKPLITNKRIEFQGKGDNQYTGDNRANFLMCSNYKNAVIKTRDDRRYAPFFTAQQEYGDLKRDGMGGDYFPKLYRWLDAGGYAIVAHYLQHYDIPDALNPAALCQRAPETSSTVEAIARSLGGIEQEVMEAIAEDRPGFMGGWVSAIALDRLLHARGDSKRITHDRRRDMLKTLGFRPHPHLPGGRVNSVIMQEGGRPRLFIKDDHISAKNLTAPVEVYHAYCKAQGYEAGAVGASSNAMVR